MFERGVFWSHIMLRRLLVWCVSFGGGRVASDGV